MERGATRHKNTPSLSLGFETLLQKSFQQGTVTLDRQQSDRAQIPLTTETESAQSNTSNLGLSKSLQQHGPKNWCSTLKPGENNWSWPTCLTLTDHLTHYLMNHLNIRPEEISMGSLVTWPHTYYYSQAAAFPSCYSSMLLLQPDLHRAAAAPDSTRRAESSLWDLPDWHVEETDLI